MSLVDIARKLGFQSTLPIQGETECTVVLYPLQHLFQSTLPIQGETMFCCSCSDNPTFQSTLPIQGETDFKHCLIHAGLISIHSPYTGRDLSERMLRIACRSFQSTLPIQGETIQEWLLSQQPIISIHSPYTGRDMPQPSIAASCAHFNPLSLYRERHNVGHCSGGFSIFQSTLPIQGETKL